MKKRMILLLISLTSLNAIAQIKFEKGYFIDNANQKINCLIKNKEWKNNPTEFEYKLSERSEAAVMDIGSLKEFGIDNVSRYVRADVRIDESSDKVTDLDYDRNPKWTEKQVLLRVLVGSKGSLFFYQKGNQVRFFYQIENNPVQQLIYKKYLSEDGSIKTNGAYKQQLLTEVNCNNLSAGNVKNLPYNQNSLVQYFQKYNRCSGAAFANLEKKNDRILHLKIAPGINYSSLRIMNYNSPDENVSLSNMPNFRIGLEVEVTLPSNKNKWRIVIDPNYKFIGKIRDVDNATETLTVKYSSLQIPLGFRYYMFLKDRAGIFLGAYYISEFASRSYIDFKHGGYYEISPETTFAFGAGLHFKKMSSELRYYTSQDLVNYFEMRGNFRQISLIFSYRIF